VSPGLAIRRLAPDDDHVAVGEIVRAAYFALPEYPHHSEYDEVIADVPGRAHHADVVVGELDGRVVACLTFVRGIDDPDAEFDDPDAASFRYFGVAPGVQGRGVGEAMVCWCIDEARRLGRHRLFIHTLESMPGALRLYERLGFVRRPEHDETWDGVLGLALTLEL
jgi:GNAT superfamily N-acetyltransferase